MFNKFKSETKFGKFLTIILVVAVIALIAVIGVWGYQEIQQFTVETDAEKIIEEFDNQFNVEIVELDNNENSGLNENQEQTSEDNSNYTETEKKSVTKKTTKKSNYSSSNNPKGTTEKVAKKRMYYGFVMTGYIRIPRNGVKLPVLESMATKALEKGVGIMMGPGLNRPGNTVIYGHNYRNRTLFSKNGRLEVGDIIYVTDEYGDTFQYTIYNTYITTPEDGSYMTRDTNGEIEISLSTCTDDSSGRIIIWARVE